MLPPSDMTPQSGLDAQARGREGSRPLDRARWFLALPRIALVGVSRDPRSFSRAVLRELAGRGIDVVPIHPEAAEIEGRRCFPRVGEAEPPVDAALVLTAPPVAAAVARDCVAAGVRAIWFHRGAGKGCATADAVAACRGAGIEPITDLCPFMALPGAGWMHRVHGAFRRRRLRASASSVRDGG